MLKSFTDILLVDTRIDVTIGDENILPPVVIKVEECGPPTEELSIDGQAGGHGFVGEKRVTFVEVEGVGVV